MPKHLLQGNRSFETHGKNADASRELTRKICKLIDLENTAEAHGWPLEINFEIVAERVSAMENTIIELACESDKLDTNIIWQTFLKDINYQIFAFSKRPSLFDVDTRRADLAGYFGPKGKQVINDTVEELLSGRIDQTQIAHTVAELADTPCRWDDANNPNVLISQQEFIDCILIPHTIVTLLSEDLETDLSDAI
ncbi:hypothetical protein B0H13DRAFT_2302352 [Mycena leptocephala]|nr:hypothetical protein B0H13DRAFT_2302352 [Mycena leptocephala]